MSLREFSPRPDPMMDELRQVRDEISAHLLTLSMEERINWINHDSDGFLEENGFETRPHPTMRNCELIVRKGS